MSLTFFLLLRGHVFHPDAEQELIAEAAAEPTSSLDQEAGAGEATDRSPSESLIRSGAGRLAAWGDRRLGTSTRAQRRCSPGLAVAAGDVDCLPECAAG